MDLEPEENMTDPSDCVTELHTKVRKGGGRKCDSVEHKGRLAWFMMHWVDGPIVVVLSIAILLVDMAIRKSPKYWGLVGTRFLMTPFIAGFTWKLFKPKIFPQRWQFWRHWGLLGCFQALVGFVLVYGEAQWGLRLWQRCVFSLFAASFSYFLAIYIPAKSVFDLEDLSFPIDSTRHLRVLLLSSFAMLQSIHFSLVLPFAAVAIGVLAITTGIAVLYTLIVRRTMTPTSSTPPTVQMAPNSPTSPTIPPSLIPPPSTTPSPSPDPNPFQLASQVSTETCAIIITLGGLYFAVLLTSNLYLAFHRRFQNPILGLLFIVLSTTIGTLAVGEAIELAPQMDTNNHQPQLLFFPLQAFQEFAMAILFVDGTPLDRPWTFFGILILVMTFDIALESGLMHDLYFTHVMGVQTPTQKAVHFAKRYQYIAQKMFIEPVATISVFFMVIFEHLTAEKMGLGPIISKSNSVGLMVGYSIVLVSELLIGRIGIFLLEHRLLRIKQDHLCYQKAKSTEMIHPGQNPVTTAGDRSGGIQSKLSRSEAGLQVHVELQDSHNLDNSGYKASIYNGPPGDEYELKLPQCGIPHVAPRAKCVEAKVPTSISVLSKCSHSNKALTSSQGKNLDDSKTSRLDGLEPAPSSTSGSPSPNPAIRNETPALKGYPVFGCVEKKDLEMTPVVFVDGRTIRGFVIISFYFGVQSALRAHE
ncbi:hypothetical protein AAMO2058_000760400 [Amorphochlora amoebiformis]